MTQQSQKAEYEWTYWFWEIAFPVDRGFIRVALYYIAAGGHSEGATPVPIPNTEVKSLSDLGSTAERWKIQDAASFLFLFSHLYA